MQNANEIRGKVMSLLGDLDKGYNSPMLGWISDYPKGDYPLEEYGIVLKTSPRGSGLLGRSGSWRANFIPGTKDVTRGRGRWIAGKCLSQMIGSGELPRARWGLYRAYDTLAGTHTLVLYSYDKKEIVATMPWEEGVSVEEVEGWLKSQPYDLYFMMKLTEVQAPDKADEEDIRAYKDRSRPYLRRYFTSLG